MTTYNYSFSSLTTTTYEPNITSPTNVATVEKPYILGSLKLEKIYINKSISFVISNNINIVVNHTISGYGYGDIIKLLYQPPPSTSNFGVIILNKDFIPYFDIFAYKPDAPDDDDIIRFDMSFNDNSRSISNQFNIPLSTDLSYVRIYQHATIKLDAKYFFTRTSTTVPVNSIQITTPTYTFIDTTFGFYRCKEGLTTVNTLSSQMYILLPDPAVNVGILFIIKDKTYNANNNNIIIIAPANGNINRVNTLTINTPGGCASLLCNGINYIIVE